MSARLHEDIQFIAGVKVHPLKMNYDERGWLTEIYRQHWQQDFNALQWNVMYSHQHVMRGVGIHRLRTDYFTVLRGSVEFGLKDLRENSPTKGLSHIVTLSASEQTALTIPPGVAHGLYFLEEGIAAFGFNHYFADDDESRCHWQDPALQINWSFNHAILNERDANAPTLKDLFATIPPFYYLSN